MTHRAGVSDRSTQLVSVSAAATVDVAAIVLLDQIFLAYRNGINQTMAALAAACLVLSLTLVALSYVHIVRTG